ncbi:LysR family transcriptional regulator [Vagococcus sp. BWB3-3]|uniref:LysR family transcriptional regulator n=1 Tax=Vagococcus allomyrinae TaxID=2794353 RepID=A0A940P9K9_9ENTE|nr:LysR family transcriptional regulator [Vagococcus allomyrinae]MBP1040472.1 LysR family transcriptional regulator [Vagococcus allomyrinae]
MDLRQLKYFIAIAEAKNITEAAKRLHIAQPPLSQMLKQLELELGTTLIERQGRQNRLTDSGKVLYNEALKITKQLEETELLVKDTNSGIKGNLALGINTLSAEELVPSLVSFQQKYPAVTFDIHQNESDVLCQMIRERQIDIALIRFPLQVDDFDVIYLNTEPFYFICDGSSKKGPNPADYIGIANSKLVLPSTKGLGVYHSIIEYLAKFQLNPHSISSCSDINLLFQLVEAGFGTSIVPKSLLTQQIHRKVEAHPLEDPLFNSSYGLITLKNTYQSTVVKKLITEITSL